jgi:hypothetical protein
MNTKAGLIGNIVGQGAQAVAGGSIAKAAGVGNIIPQTYGGSAVAGALQGAIQPLSSDQGEGSRLVNAGIGLAGGVGGRALVNLGGAGVRGIRALVDPLTDSGQNRIVGSTIGRFANGQISPSTSAIPGVQPNLAEATGDAGLAQLQRAVTDSEPAIAGQFVDQAAKNNSARLDYLRSLGGTKADVANA